MATKEECVLYNPDMIGGRDTLCDQCINKAAAYDEIHLDLMTIGLRLRQVLDHSSEMTAPEFAMYARIVVTDLLQNQCGTVLAEYDAQEKREAEFKRHAEAATLKKEGVIP
jgi:hypothetical protein